MSNTRNFFSRLTDTKEIDKLRHKPTRERIVLAPGEWIKVVPISCTKNKYFIQHIDGGETRVWKKNSLEAEASRGRKKALNAPSSEKTVDWAAPLLSELQDSTLTTMLNLQQTEEFMQSSLPTRMEIKILRSEVKGYNETLTTTAENLLLKLSQLPSDIAPPEEAVKSLMKLSMYADKKHKRESFPGEQVTANIQSQENGKRFKK